MKEMIVEISNHQYKNDVVVCYKLINYIMDSKINSVDDLKSREESYFSTDDINKRLEECYDAFLVDRTHLEELDQNEMDQVLTNSEKYETSKTIEEKIICIVRMYVILGWEFRFPFSTYKLIMEDRFN